VVVSLLWARAAQARRPDVHFEWRRPTASLCPTREALQADVEEALGRRVFTSRAAARVMVRGEVVEGASGVSVELDATDARGRPLGRRSLNAAAGECPTLRGAIGLVLTLFVEYEPPSSLEVVLGVGADLSLAGAPMPRTALSAGPALYLALGRIARLHASVHYWPPVSIRTARGVGASLQALSLELRGCARSSVGLGLCAGVENGALVSSPRRLAGPARQARLLAHGLLEAGWELDLYGAVRVDFGLGALLSLSRPRFAYLRADGERMAVYQPPLWGILFRATVIIPGG